MYSPEVPGEEEEVSGDELGALFFRMWFTRFAADVLT